MVYDSSCFSVSPSPYFHEPLRDYSLSFARDKQAGTRLLISHYISHAIIQVKTHFNLSNIVSFPEYHIGPEEIPNMVGSMGI